MSLWEKLNRYHKELNRYVKGGWVARITTLLLLIALAGGALLCEYWSFNAYSQDVLLGIVASIITLGLIITAIQMCGTYAFVGFTSATINFAGDVANYIDQRKNKKRLRAQLETQNFDGADITQQDLQAQQSANRKKRTGKWFDILLGIVCVLLTIGVLVGMVWMFVEIVLIK